MPTPVDLDELLVLVRDEESFIRFVEALGADFASERLLEHNAPSSIDRSDSQEWENGTVDAFLDAAAAWAHASNRSPLADSAQPNVWQRCAAILFAGKFYE
ncbi:hypothetical protein CFN16_11845 [Pseudomonas fluorescens]|uniref:DUF7660 domain-containing protein n=1 Tax=Pseudomonas fluorescens TaxID=294 RepID=A0A345UWD4_PSEFL|nr:hypothetical protein [Pseudomonas fluorescens]AXJ04786.1 hypothetical protein CFN16_11845 [Pseudomonas fluorescens]